MKFIKKVTFYKICGAFVWALFINNGLSARIVFFPLAMYCSYVWAYEGISILILPFLMLSFMKTLKNIPTPLGLLHLSELIHFIFWLFLDFVYLYMESSAFIDVEVSIIISSIVCFYTLITQPNAFYFTFTKENRFQKFLNSLRSQILYRFIFDWRYFVSLSIISGFLFVLGGPLSIIVLFHTISCSDVIYAITTVVASEPVSFSSTDNKRLINGLNSSNYYERFLSFQDLYTISGGNNLRRKFLFEDPSGRAFSSIVESCSRLLTSFCRRQERMIQLGNSKIPIHRVNDEQWKRSQIRGQNDLRFEDVKKKSFFQRLFSGSKKKDVNRTERLIRETDALEYSPLVLLSVQSIVRFLFILPKEDKYGVGQIYAEKILDMLLTTKSTLDKTLNHAFVLSSFGKGWFASSPMDLSLKTIETVDWGVNEILKHFPSQLDYSRLSKKNIDLVQRLLGRRIFL